jgi:hypothetical protein
MRENDVDPIGTGSSRSTGEPGLKTAGCRSKTAADLAFKVRRLKRIRCRAPEGTWIIVGLTVMGFSEPPIFLGSKVTSRSGIVVSSWQDL